MTKDTLITARGFIDTPGKWIKGDMALDASGLAVAPNDGTATCFCIMGALHKAARNFNALARARAELETRLPIGTVLPHYNDRPGTSHADVLALFDEAIATSEP